MVGIAREDALERGIEAALRRDRRVAVVSLALVVALAWLYLWHDARSMQEAGLGYSSGAAATPAVSLGGFALTFLMWAIMMIGMMLPSVAPTMLLYGSLVRKNRARGAVLPAVWIFGAGYLAVWTGYSLLVTVVQVALQQGALLTPLLESASRPFSAMLLLAAGLYQWMPLKEACLRRCRHPLEFLMTRWRAGSGGAFRMGVEHGGYCVGCCWALMLLLFVAGVMNLAWIALLAAVVFVEKLLPAGRFVRAGLGAVLVASGLALLIVH